MVLHLFIATYDVHLVLFLFVYDINLAPSPASGLGEAIFTPWEGVLC